MWWIVVLLRIKVLLVGVLTGYLAGTVHSQTLCEVDLEDGTVLKVPPGEHEHPDFCNKLCNCTISYPDLTTGIPLFSSDCTWVCSRDGDDGKRHCLDVQERGIIPGHGLCACRRQSGLPTLQCNIPYDPTPAPTESPTLVPTLVPTPSEQRNNVTDEGTGDGNQGNTPSNPMPIAPTNGGSAPNPSSSVSLACFNLSLFILGAFIMSLVEL